MRIFLNEESCLRPIRALAVEAYENWVEANRYLDMGFLKDQNKRKMTELADRGTLQPGVVECKLSMCYEKLNCRS